MFFDKINAEANEVLLLFLDTVFKKNKVLYFTGKDKQKTTIFNCSQGLIIVLTVYDDIPLPD